MQTPEEVIEREYENKEGWDGRLEGKKKDEAGMTVDSSWLSPLQIIKVSLLLPS